MTMESAAVPIEPVELQPPAPDEPALAADDIRSDCGSGG